MEFHAKLKKVKRALMQWSKKTYGNLFERVATLEDVIGVRESQFEINPTKENNMKLKKAEAELTRYYAIEEEFWKQKAGLRYFKDGDRNTKFFHSVVKGRWKRLYISEILDKKKWIAGQYAARDWHGYSGIFFKGQFSETALRDWADLMKNIPPLITQEDNDIMAVVTLEEVIMVVQELNGDNTPGPDGFTGIFFQQCWEIIGEDVTKLVRVFFCGHMLSRFITHINLVFLPKRMV